ncbi:hypothetical protein [Parvibaculum sp.]|uniref:hypothetical protein n=1 Tax=Parvibaculum sp. TaxID=2024848 RepID=UPI003919EAB5
MDSITLPGMMLLAALATGGGDANVSKPELAGQQYASATCSLSGQARAGARKICYYDCGGFTRSVAIPSAKVCAHTIRR